MGRLVSGFRLHQCEGGSKSMKTGQCSRRMLQWLETASGLMRSVRLHKKVVPSMTPAQTGDIVAGVEMRKRVAAQLLETAGLTAFVLATLTKSSNEKDERNPAGSSKYKHLVIRCHWCNSVKWWLWNPFRGLLNLFSVCEALTHSHACIWF